MKNACVLLKPMRFYIYINVIRYVNISVYIFFEGGQIKKTLFSIKKTHDALEAHASLVSAIYLSLPCQNFDEYNPPSRLIR